MLNENCYENLIGLVTPFDFPSQEGRFSMMASEVCRAKQVACFLPLKWILKTTQTLACKSTLNTVM